MGCYHYRRLLFAFITVSEQFRGVNNVAFYGTLGTPVALVLGVSAYTAVNVLIKLSVDDGK